MRPTTHHPPHIYLDDTWYMITSSVYGGRYMLQPEGYKDLVRDQLKALVAEFKLILAAWVVLDNHTHVLIKSHVGAELNRFIGRWHGRSSFDLNTRDNERGRQVWHNFWDTCIRSEADYWTHFNYIHYNPVKHGYVKHLEDWPFSSYRHYLVHRGEAWLLDALERYPVIDFTDPNDRFDGQPG
jgi:putative transposase